MCKNTIDNNFFINYLTVIRREFWINCTSNVKEFPKFYAGLRQRILESNITSFVELAGEPSNVVTIEGKTYLTFDRADDQKYATWNLEGYSEFIFTVNLLTGTQYGIRPTSCELSAGDVIVEGITTRVGEKVSSIKNLQLIMNTYDVNTGLKNKVAANFPLNN